MRDVVGMGRFSARCADERQLFHGIGLVGARNGDRNLTQPYGVLLPQTSLAADLGAPGGWRR